MRCKTCGEEQIGVGHPLTPGKVIAWLCACTRAMAATAVVTTTTTSGACTDLEPGELHTHCEVCGELRGVDRTHGHRGPAPRHGEEPR